jgi:O-antigen ligase
LGALPFAALAVILLVVSPLARVVLVVFGGLLVFQSSQSLDAPKIAYLAVFTVAFAAALPNFRRALEGSGRAAQGIVAGAFVFAAMLLLSLAVSLAHGDDLSLWVRGAAPYFLFAAMPVFALDAALSVPKRTLTALLLLAGTVATAAYVVEWAARRRDLVQLALNHVALPSTLLPAALLALAVAYALRARRFRWLWAGIAGLVLLAMLLTGSRSNLVLLAALPFAYLSVGGRPVSRTLRFVAVAVVALALAAAGLAIVQNSPGFAGGVLADRLASVVTILSNPTSDASFRDRAAETAAALRDWSASPFLGTGPAHLVVWSTPGGDGGAWLDIDSPLMYPMRFGLLGVAVLGGVALSWLGFIRGISPSVARATLAGVWGVALAWSLIGSALDDKGFTMALLLGLAIALVPDAQVALALAGPTGSGPRAKHNVLGDRAHLRPEQVRSLIGYSARQSRIGGDGSLAVPHPSFRRCGRHE